jgi:hypothetical protein
MIIVGFRRLLIRWQEKTRKLYSYVAFCTCITYRTAGLFESEFAMLYMYMLLSAIFVVFECSNLLAYGILASAVSLSLFSSIQKDLKTDFFSVQSDTIFLILFISAGIRNITVILHMSCFRRLLAIHHTDDPFMERHSNDSKIIRV